MAPETIDPNTAPPLRVRTITAGREIPGLPETGLLEEDLVFLDSARSEFLQAGLEVQTVRLATQSLVRSADAKFLSLALPVLERMDSLVSEIDALLSGELGVEEGRDLAHQPGAERVTERLEIGLVCLRELPPAVGEHHAGDRKTPLLRGLQGEEGVVDCAQCGAANDQKRQLELPAEVRHAELPSCGDQQTAGALDDQPIVPLAKAGEGVTNRFQLHGSPLAGGGHGRRSGEGEGLGADLLQGLRRRRGASQGLGVEGARSVDAGLDRFHHAGVEAAPP